MPITIVKRLVKNRTKVRRNFLTIKLSISYDDDDDDDKIRLYISELFHMSTSTGGRKRPFVPKQTKHAKQNDAKRRKLDNDSHRGSRNTDKSDDKQNAHKKKNTKFGGESKFGGNKSGKANTNADKSNSSSSNAAAGKKKLKKTKPKKPKGKKKSHRNKNK